MEVEKGSFLSRYRIILLTSIVVMVALVTAACGSGNAKPTPAPPTAVPTTAPKATEAPAAQPTEAPTAEAQPTEAPTAEAQPTEAPTAEAQPTEAISPTVMLHEDAKLGNILVGSNGMTLYAFDNDSQGKSACNNGCATNWPPLTVQSENATLTAGEGITGTLAVITRDDGTYQVTINGQPLYYYAKDTNVGDTTGQGFSEVWWVVGADGNKVTTK